METRQIVMGARYDLAYTARQWHTPSQFGRPARSCAALPPAIERARLV